MKYIKSINENIEKEITREEIEDFFLPLKDQFSLNMSVREIHKHNTNGNTFFVVTFSGDKFISSKENYLIINNLKRDDSFFNLLKELEHIQQNLEFSNLISMLTYDKEKNFNIIINKKDK